MKIKHQPKILNVDRCKYNITHSYVSKNIDNEATVDQGRDVI